MPHTYARAGCPNLIGRFAKPTYGPQYQASYVGGGTLFGGDPRTREEGTWGRDYVGHHFYRRVWLDWSHGRRYQGGEGAYKTDGPKIIHHE